MKPLSPRLLLLLCAIVVSLFATAGTPSLAAPTPQRGGTLRVCAWEELTNLNPYICCTLGWPTMIPAMLERLISFDPAGRAVPVLAREVPTVSNGGVADGGKTITYHLRQGVKWADGEAFSSDDVKFSYEYLMRSENQVSSRAGFELVERIETPDPLTAVVHYKRYYAPWMTIPWFIIPKHILEKEPNFNKIDWDLKMMGTGPFFVSENVAGDHLTLSRNEHYWQQGKPYLDKIVVLWISDREAQKARFKAGDCDMIVDLIETDIASMKAQPDVQVYVASGGIVERLMVNTASNRGPTRGDPKHPHFFLGDVRVRQALDYAINKKEMVDTVLAGVNRVATSECPGGWAQPAAPPRAYDPARARALLQEAGWVDADKDGIRECRGCRYGSPGEKASIVLRTTTAKFRQLDAQLIQRYLRNVGVELKVETPTGALFWGTYTEGGLAATGNFDLDMWADMCWVDPAPTLEQLYGSSRIPSAKNPAGRNVTRFVNSEYDKMLSEGASALSRDERAQAYKRALLILNDQVPVVHLFDRAQIAAARTSKVKDWTFPAGTPNPWLPLADNFQNIYIVQR